MNQDSCPHEARVTNAARTGGWDDSLKAHVAECTYCREVTQVVECLTILAKTCQDEPSLIDAKRVWLSARISRREAACEHALRPVAFAEAVAKVAGTLVLAAGIAWSWFDLYSYLIDELPKHWQALRNSSFPIPDWLLVLPRSVPLTLTALAMGSVIALLIRNFGDRLFNLEIH